MVSFYRSSCHPSAWLVVVASSSLLGGCREEPPLGQADEIPPDTDGVSEPVGDTEGGDTDGDTDGTAPPTKVCRTSPLESTPGDTVVWLCDGYAQSKREFEVDEAAMIVAAKDALGAVAWAVAGGEVTDFINSLEDYSDTNYDQFGPKFDGYEEAAERKQVVACCEDGYDYPNTVQPDDAAVVSEHGQACAIDCVDQTCRSVAYQLAAFGDLAVEKSSVSLAKDIQEDFYALANFYNEYGFSDCVSGYADAPLVSGSPHRVAKEGAFDVG